MLEALLDCPSCGHTFTGTWPGGDAVTGQELSEPPVAEQQCPSCGTYWTAEYPGWTFYTEPG